MNVFIFPRIQQLTSNYHPEGGLVVVARHVPHVEALIAAQNIDGGRIEITAKEWDGVLMYRMAAEAEPRVILFPDAGCC